MYHVEFDENMDMLSKEIGHAVKDTTLQYVNKPENIGLASEESRDDLPNNAAYLLYEDGNQQSLNDFV
jgi:hypothetical protein